MHCLQTTFKELVVLREREVFLKSGMMLERKWCEDMSNDFRENVIPFHSARESKNSIACTLLIF